SQLAARGVDVILNPSASHFAFQKHRVRRRFVLEGSRAFGVTYVFSNVLGNSSGRMIFDGGAMIAAGGRMVAEGPRFSYDDVVLTSAVVDIDTSRLATVQIGSFMPDFEASSAGRIRAPGFRWPAIDGTTTKPSSPAPLGREEEFTRATTLGLFDYQRKSRSRGAVVSLSGGADSAATSALVALMLRSAVLELGLDAVKAKLSYMDLDDVDGVEALVERLLLCVYQSTRNSSETTLEAARAVAEGLGAEFAVLDVDSIVEAYREKVEGALGRPLTWERDDLTLQNIQARSRSPGIWMFANLRGALLLSTSNRSEAAVGYATMDGDTSGGLSPIAGIDKAFLRRWLRWLEVEGLPGLGPIPA
ncbi:MAG: NAD(+) synthase, partial [Acidobacteriota bacterium]